MNVAVIGGGSAGFMAAAHMTRCFPEAKLYHIYDTHLPTIGVGEGTTPPVKHWLHEITGLPFADLQTHCRMTHKEGIRFEGWGSRHAEYIHYFSPAREGTAYHLSAERLADLLRGYIIAEHLDRFVRAIKSDDNGVWIDLGEGTDLQVDWAFDARGFPTRDTMAPLLDLSWIPTNAALLRHGPVAAFQTATRAVARPHGWIFVIPLLDSTSYGYIFNQTLSLKADVEEDFDVFLHREGVPQANKTRHLTFPNFVRHHFLDGCLFTIGNAASFLEPLEATALGIILEELRMASFWMTTQLLGWSDSDEARTLFNRQLTNFVKKTALFISWHYACGSAYETPFWCFAQAAYRSALQEDENKALLPDFQRYQQIGASFPRSLAFTPSTAPPLKPVSLPATTDVPFGGFLDVSFAKVGHGIGFYD